MNNWTTCKISDICSSVSDTYKGTDEYVVLVNTSDVLEGKILNHTPTENKNLKGQFKKTFRKNDILYSEIRPANKRFAFVDIENTGNYIASTKLMVLRCDETKVLPKFLFSLLKSSYIINELQLLAETRSGTFPQITFSGELGPMEINLPDFNTQRKIVSVLDSIENKMELSNNMNSNLEQQMQAIFINMFGESIDALDECDTTLSDLVESVDNRGKTPPLSPDITNYPIIDVRALSGSSRIIDYNNCSKFVDEETYNNWFRSGHPQPYDILISTVGSLAEMKLFLGTVGCIAQNVVGFRCKQVSPLYIYQYLNYIKNDLVAYNIGSVQPSIKVTHIIKHHIFLPDKCEIDKFDAIAREMTKQIYANCKENENLTHLRDTLLPKLMSGEIDLSSIDV